MNNFEDLARQILDLPLDQRSILAERLLESLDELGPQELEQVSAAEAERRFEAFKEGKIESISGSEVHRELLEELT